jgi:hypothetical protein
MMKSEITRRNFLEKTAYTAAATLTLGYLLAGCKSEGDAGAAKGAGDTKKQAASGDFSCTDVSGLSDADKATRESLKYVDKTPDPAKPCDACALYTQPTGGAQCGGCTVVKGPIHPKGYCTAWAPKPA